MVKLDATQGRHASIPSSSAWPRRIAPTRCGSRAGLLPHPTVIREPRSVIPCRLPSDLFRGSPDPTLATRSEPIKDPGTRPGMTCGE